MVVVITEVIMAAADSEGVGLAVEVLADSVAVAEEAEEQEEDFRKEQV